MRIQHACVAAAMLLVACGDLPHDNPRDPQAPADTQGRVTLAGTVTLEPPGGTPPSLSAIHVSVAGHSWAADTDASGHYEISGVPVGTWVVQFTRAGWDDQVVSGVGVTLDQAGEQIPLPPIELKVSRGNIAGTIALEGEDGAGGVAISLDAVPSASSVHWASAVAPGESAVLTNADGRFVLTGIPVGEYVLRASKTGFLDGTVASVTVTPSGVTTLDRLLLFMNPGGFSGSVLVQGATSSAGVTIRASGTTLGGSPWESTVTGRTDGTFLLSGVPGGTYNVSFEREGCVPALVGAAVRPGEVTALPPVLLAPATGVVTGAVALSAGSVAGFPVPADRSGITVSLTGRDGSVNSVLTDAAGNYRFNDVPVSLDAQGYGVSARLAGYEQSAVVRVYPLARTAVSADPLTLQLAAGAIGGRIELWDNIGGGGTANASAAGTVVSLSGTAFDGTPWSASATTDADGSFLAANLPRGAYDLTASSPGRACDPLPRTQVGYGAVATVATARCRDAVAPGALVLGLPVPAEPAQPGYTNSGSVPARILTQAIDPTGNLRGYQTAIGATPDWTTAQVVEGTPSTLPFTLTPDPVSLGNQKFVLWARAFDWTGNTGPATSIEIVYDGIGPLPPSISTSRHAVNATTASVTVAGGFDPNFLRYEYCIGTCPLTAAAGAPPWSPTGTSLAVSIPANGSIDLYVRAVDRAGNTGDAAHDIFSSDMTPPVPPQMAPGYDPTRFTVRAPSVDFLVAAAAHDSGIAADWQGVAWLEVDDGSGFKPLCDEASCRDETTWTPCATSCVCPDERRICVGDRFAGVRVALSAVSRSTTVSFRAVDLVGNVGPSTSQQVLARAVPDEVAEAEVIVHGPIVRDQLVGYEVDGQGWLLDLGANRQLDVGDERCLLTTEPTPYAPVTPLGRDVVAYGRVDSGDTQLLLRLPRATSLCTGATYDLWITNVQQAGFLAGDREHLVWAENGGAGWRVMMREAQAGGRVGDPLDQVLELLPVGQLASVKGIWMGGPTVLVEGCPSEMTDDGLLCTWLAISPSPDPTGRYGSGWRTTALSIPASSGAFHLSKDGSAMAYRDSTGFTYVRLPGPGGLFGDGDDTMIRVLAPLTHGASLAIDAQHLALMDAEPSTGLVDLFAVGLDGVWGTDDGVPRYAFPNSDQHRYPDLDQGVLAYALTSSVEVTDLSRYRWETPLLAPFDPVIQADALVSNGADTVVWTSVSTQQLWARTAAGALTDVEQCRDPRSPSDPTDPTHGPCASQTLRVLAAEGRNLLVSRSPDRALLLYPQADDGRFLTRAPATLAMSAVDARLGRPSAGGSARPTSSLDHPAIVYEDSTSSPTGKRCWILEPGLGPLASVETTGTKLELEPGACPANGSLGINDFQAIFGCSRGGYCVIAAGPNGLFGPEDLAGVPPLALPGIDTSDLPSFELSGARLILNSSTAGTTGVVLLDAGPDHRFGTADDRVRVLTPRPRLRAHEVAVAGDWAAWLDTVSGTDQVFVLHGFDGAPRQITTTVSAKSSVTVDAMGRVHWVDTAIAPKAVMSWEP